MQNPRQIIIDGLKKWQEENSLSGEFDVSLSQNPDFGDFATNIALVLRVESASPREVAQNVVNYLNADQNVKEVIEKIEIAGPGFINFFLKLEYLTQMIQEITQDDRWQENLKTKNPQKIMVEFGDPNPFKEIHIGHLRNFCIGESFSRLLEAQGHHVIRVNYQGDVGLHVAKALWGLLKRKERFLDNGVSEAEKVKILAESYVEGATEYESNENVKQEIIEINKRIYGNDESLYQLWEEGRKVSLEHFEEMYKRIGLNYDKYYFESETAKRGKEIVKNHVEDGVFEESDGAIVYRGDKEGLHTRVFLTSQDYATYEGKDLALAIMKNEDENPDVSYILTGNEQADYFAVMLSALQKIDPEVARKTKHYTFGHVRLKNGKMSSRTGDVITANWLLDEAERKAFSLAKQTHEFGDKEVVSKSDKFSLSAQQPNLGLGKRKRSSEEVGIGAVRYSMLKFGITSDIYFDFDESISLHGNSGPYLQYTYVRTQSVLEKANHELEDTSHELVDLQKEEKDLLRYLAQYRYHLEMAAVEFAPNLLCNYLFELAQKFNLFYQQQRIVGSDNEVFRLKLTQAVGTILKHGLNTLGISTVEEM